MTVHITPAERIEIKGSGEVWLKQLISEDAEAMFPLIDLEREHVQQYDEVAAAFTTVAGLKRSIIMAENAEGLDFGIWDNKKVFGGITLNVRPGHIAELVYWVGKDFAGSEYAAEALKLFAKYVFENKEIGRLVAFVTPGNKASEATLIEAGFTPVGLVFVNRKPRWEFELRQPLPQE